MKKPLIGITLDNEEPGGYSKFSWYAIRYNYLHSIEAMGGIPFPLFHSSKDINYLSKLLDGLIITGGNFDINPKIYGKKFSGTRETKNIRTNFEIKIFKKFLKDKKPILGICGGHQLINVACGGTLIQDINKEINGTIEHEQENSRDEISHEVQIIEKSKLKKILIKKNIKVNSAHHQAVKKLGKNLIVSGNSKDGIIECIEHINHPWCIGVQWHPEFLITNEDKKLVKNFVNLSATS